MSNYLFLLIFLGIVILIGALVYVLVSRDSQRLKVLERELDETKRRLESEREAAESYRQDVSQHFVTTARLVNNLTRSYKDVYDHLEHGVYRLVGEETFRRELEEGQAPTVVLGALGQAASPAVSENGPETPVAELGDDTEALESATEDLSETEPQAGAVVDEVRG